MNELKLKLDEIKNKEEISTYIDLFSTDGLHLEEIHSFLEMPSNEKYVRMFFYDFGLHFNEYFLFNRSYRIKDLSTYKLLVKYICSYAIYVEHNVDLENIKNKKLISSDFKEQFKSFQNKEGECYYRGQTDYQWGLVPSFLDNIYLIQI